MWTGCLCAHIYVWMYLCFVCSHICICVCAGIYTCLYRHIVCVQVCMCICVLYMCVYRCACVYMYYVCMLYLCTHVCVCMYFALSLLPPYISDVIYISINKRYSGMIKDIKTQKSCQKTQFCSFSLPASTSTPTCLLPHRSQPLPVSCKAEAELLTGTKEGSDQGEVPWGSWDAAVFLSNSQRYPLPSMVYWLTSHQSRFMRLSSKQSTLFLIHHHTKLKRPKKWNSTSWHLNHPREKVEQPASSWSQIKQNILILANFFLFPRGVLCIKCWVIRTLRFCFFFLDLFSFNLCSHENFVYSC